MRRLATTPRFDAWRERLRAATAGRGVKADLARHMAAVTGQSLRTWTQNLAKIWRPDSMIAAEYLLEIDAWLATRSSPPASSPRTPTDGPGKKRKFT